MRLLPCRFLRLKRKLYRLTVRSLTCVERQVWLLVSGLPVSNMYPFSLRCDIICQWWSVKNWAWHPSVVLAVRWQLRIYPVELSRVELCRRCVVYLRARRLSWPSSQCSLYVTGAENRKLGHDWRLVRSHRRSDFWVASAAVVCIGLKTTLLNVRLNIFNSPELVANKQIITNTRKKRKTIR